MMDFEERRNMLYPLPDLYKEIQTQAIEKMDEFIFRTVEPYCNTISEIRISKSLLKRALFEYFGNHPEERGCIK